MIKAVLKSINFGGVAVGLQLDKSNKLVDGTQGVKIIIDWDSMGELMNERPLVSIRVGLYWVLNPGGKSHYPVTVSNADNKDWIRTTNYVIIEEEELTVFNGQYEKEILLPSNSPRVEGFKLGSSVVVGFLEQTHIWIDWDDYSWSKKKKILPKGYEFFNWRLKAVKQGVSDDLEVVRLIQYKSRV